MKKIKTIAISISIPKAQTLFSMVKSAFDERQNLQADALLCDVMAEIGEKREQLLKVASKKKESFSLKKQDEIRDKSVRAIFTILKGYALLPNEAKRNAAKNLLQALKNYSPSIAGETYAVESAHIKEVILMLSKEEHKSDVALLDGLGETVAELKKAEDDLMVMSVKGVEGKKSVSAYKLKNELVEIFNSKLVPYLNAASLIRPQEYAEFASYIAQLLADAKR